MKFELPKRLRALLTKAGYKVALEAERDDGAPITAYDERAIKALVVGYEADEGPKGGKRGPSKI